MRIALVIFLLFYPYSAHADDGDALGEAVMEASGLNDAIDAVAEAMGLDDDGDD